jgi:hypothetical protein
LTDRKVVYEVALDIVENKLQKDMKIKIEI